MDNMVISIIKIYVKVIVIIMVSYLLFNLFSFWNYKLIFDKHAKTLQKVVENFGMVPPKMVDATVGVLESKFGVGNPQTQSLSNSNVFDKFIRNVVIYIEDFDVNSETGEITSKGKIEYKVGEDYNNRHTIFNPSGNGGNKRRNFGGIKKVGIKYTYRWFNPIYAYAVISKGDDGKTSDGSISGIGYNIGSGRKINNIKNKQGELSVEEKIENNTLSIPVEILDTSICMHAYSDMDFN